MHPIDRLHACVDLFESAKHVDCGGESTVDVSLLGHRQAEDSHHGVAQVIRQDDGDFLFIRRHLRCEPGGSPENLNLPTTVAIDYETVPFFQKFADPKFKLEFVIVVANQFGSSKVNVFGFGKMEGADYSTTEQAATKRP